MLNEQGLEIKFNKAQAIYPKALLDQKNVSLFFVQDALIKDNGVLLITGHNLYRIFDNGKLIGYGPARSAHGYYRVDNYKLNKGHHHLVIEHVYYHCNNYCSTNMDGFIQCEIYDSDNLIAFSGNTNQFNCYLNDTRYQRVVRFSYQRAFSESYHFDFDMLDFYLGKKNLFKQVDTDIMMQVSLLKRGVDYPLFRELSFNKIEEGVYEEDLSLPTYEDRYMVLEHLSIFKKDEWEVNPNDYISHLVYKLQKVDELKESTFITYALNVSKTGFLAFDIDCLEDSELYFVFDELDASIGQKTPKEILFYRNTTHNIVSYECKKGKHHHLTVEPYTMKYVRLVVKKGKIRVNSLTFKEYQNPLNNAIQYHFDNQKIQEVCNAAVSTFAQNAVDILTDCPSRERAGWLCDSFFTSKAEDLLLGSNKVEHNFLENYSLLKQYPSLPKGMIPMCYPGDHPDGVFIPNWSLWYILELKEYLSRTGDNKLIEASKEKIRGLLDYFAKFENEYGLLEDLENWVFVEWSKANDEEFVKGVNFPSNMLYVGALEAAYELLNQEELLIKANNIKTKIEELSFNGEFYIDNMIRDENHHLIKTDHITETCQYYAFYFKIATLENHKELFSCLKNEFGPKRDYLKSYPNIYKSNVIIGDYLRLFILLRYGYVDLVKEETVDYFYNMAKTTGTLWEHDSPAASLNHGLTSCILNIICSACFGLVSVDQKEKVIYLSSKHVKENGYISLFVKEGTISLRNENGVIYKETPLEYRIVFVD